jgi:1,4-dihydroxy-2-naphthoate octaprenyltransferase
VAPVLVGTAVAHTHGAARALPALAALLGAVLIQIGTNLANDLFDAQKGADTDDRIGPPRAVQMGWLSPAQMRNGVALVFGAAAGVGAIASARPGPCRWVGSARLRCATAWRSSSARRREWAST